MTYLTKLNMEKRQQRDTLMGYMNARNLSLQLRDDICTFLASSKKQVKTKVQCESDIASLKTLPEGILMRLRIEVHMPVIERHALFKQCVQDEPSMVYRLCHRAITERGLASGEELFRFGVRCSRMYFMVSGESKYVLGFGEDEPYKVGPGQWLCEAALWVEWEHRGSLHARSTCEISQLDATEFSTIMTRSQHLYEIQRYARIYAHHAERESGGAEFVIDLWGQRLRVMDMVQKAFKPDETDAENPASKIMLMWCGETLGISEAFETWKKVVQDKKRCFVFRAMSDIFAHLCKRRARRGSERGPSGMRLNFSGGMSGRTSGRQSTAM